MKIVLRWGLPALATVVGGTWLAISATASAMHADLDARTATVLAGAGHAWAEVVFDGRDAVVSGTVGDTRMAERLVAELSRVHGVRSVRSRVVGAESVSPYPFVVRLDGGVVTVSGGVPDDGTRTELLSRLDGATDELRILSGTPPRALWHAAVDTVLEWSPRLDEGEIALSDLDLTVKGRARTHDDYDALLGLAELPLPDGVALVSHEIAPPLVSPFVWRAEFDGRAVSLGGYVTDEDLLDRLRADVQDSSADHALSASVLLASGAPEGFGDTARLLLRNLLLLESGSAEISDGTATLAGAPPDPAVASAIRAELDASGVAPDLEPPRARDYRLVLSRDGDGVAVSGFVPDREMLDRLSARPGLDLAAVSLARGAPERFESGIEFGLALLEHLSEGTFEIHNTTLSVAGRAATAAGFEAVETRLALGAPQGLILSGSDVRPPLASPFVWSASKEAEGGGVAFSGFVPDTPAREALRAAAGGPVDDAAGLADGAPDDFVEVAVRALEILALLPTGSIAYDGGAWSISGAVASPGDAVAVEEAFALAGLGQRGAELMLDVPPPEEIVLEDYAWRADKGDDGTITLSGQVPDDDLKRFLYVRAGESALDTSEIAAGAPPGFLGDALAGLEALSHLASGFVALEDGQWSLAGVPTTAEAAELAAAALMTATAEGVGWIKDLAAPLAVVEPDVIAPAAPEPEVTGADPVSPSEADPESPSEAVDEASLPESVDVDAPEAADDVQKPFIFMARMGLLEPVVLEGAVPAEAARRYFGVVAGDVDTEKMTLREDLPADFVTQAEFGIRLLRTLHAGTVGFDGERWVLEGKVETTGERNAALAALPAAPATSHWDTNIYFMTPLDVCWEKVTAFADRNVILFASGSARIEEESVPALDELAGYLARCPDASVNVEGHTDSDGDAAANLALSVARAEAVVAALIERGVSYRRLYAIGYGQTLPIADNATSAGKRANRRIVFSFFDDAEGQDVP